MSAKQYVYYNVNSVEVVKMIENGIEYWIPFDSGNSGYQEYLAWLAQGNQPEVVGG